MGDELSPPWASEPFILDEVPTRRLIAYPRRRPRFRFGLASLLALPILAANVLLVVDLATQTDEIRPSPIEMHIVSAHGRPVPGANAAFFMDRVGLVAAGAGGHEGIVREINYGGDRVRRSFFRETRSEASSFRKR